MKLREKWHTRGRRARLRPRVVEEYAKIYKVDEDTVLTVKRVEQRGASYVLHLVDDKGRVVLAKPSHVVQLAPARDHDVRP